MPLTICATTDERFVSVPVERAIRHALAECGRATLLVPSFAVQLAACKELTQHEGLSLGVSVTTPSAWVAERWEVWGDGTRIVDSQSRTAALGVVCEDSRSGVHANAGTVQVLSRLASDALPWLPRGAGGRIDRESLMGEGLTLAEASIVSLLDEYEQLLADAGLIETSSAAARVVERVLRGGGSLWPVVCTGFSDLRRPERELISDLAARSRVTLVTPRGNAAAYEARDASVGLLARACEEAGVEVVREEDYSPAPSPRADELELLLAGIYLGADDALEPSGAVCQLLPAGPVAEAEAVAQEVQRLAAAGDGEIVVVAPDAARAWRELSPKLVARGVSVAAELSERFRDLEAGRAFLEFAQEVARLAALDLTWPEPVATEEGTLIRLGDMSWWPPRPIVDFLLSDVAHMDRRRAQDLDRRWRQNRLLTPGAVLEALQNPGQTSQEVAGATAELLRGRLGSAASRLLAPFAAAGAQEGDADPGSRDPLSDERATKSLEAVMTVGRTLKSLGISTDPAAPRRLGLVELVERASRILDVPSVALRPSAEVPGAFARVRILSPTRASQLAPSSADAVILCGQTSEEQPVGTGDDVTSALLQTLALEPEVRPISQVRSVFWLGMRAARRHVVLERALFGADSRETYPSVMLSELLSCYGEAASDDTAKVPVRGSLPETQACLDLSPSGSQPAPVMVDTPAPAGAVTGEARSLINVPREGVSGLPQGRPVLSASQIETYLECPYKWFSLRRLRLEDSDVGFAPVQMGTFAHRVLEVTHRALLDEGLAGMRARGEEVPDVLLHPEVRVPGSRVSVSDGEGLLRAKALLADELEAHTRHMFLKKRDYDARNALVPHTAQDEGLLHTLRRDLQSVLDFEAEALDGFEPRFFEWDFGKGELEPYAGAWIRGTVDRVDVSAHGGAIVIDYKHRKGAGLIGEYAARASAGAEREFVLPRHVQALMYAQVIRRRFPGLHVQGALYLTTGGTSHVLSGAVDADQLDNVFGRHRPSSKALDGVSVGRDDTFGMKGERGMEALLDATEEAIAQAVRRMLEGDIEARPTDARACDWCPVMNCERRLAG